MKRTDAELKRIRTAVLQSTTVCASNGGKPLNKRQAAKADRYCNTFIENMNSETPLYESEDAAINAIAPIAVWFFGWAARQFAIWVIKALWREWHTPANH